MGRIAIYPLFPGGEPAAWLRVPSSSRAGPPPPEHGLQCCRGIRAACDLAVSTIPRCSGKQTPLGFHPGPGNGFQATTCACWEWRGLAGSGGPPSRFLQPLRKPVNDVFKEGAQSSQALISCSNVIVPLFFERVEKGDDTFACQIRQRHDAELLAGLPGDELQE